MARHSYILPNEAIKFIGSDFKSSFKVFHANLQSARNKSTSLESLLSQINVQFDVLMLTETWYDTADYPFCLPEYDSCTLNREYGRGGGVMMLIRKDIKYERLPVYTRSSSDFEVLSVLSHRKLFVTIYRPPAGNLDTFFNFLESLFSYTNDNDLSLVCGGDFNINLLDSSSPVKHFKLMLEMYYIRNTISLPTRVTLQSSTLIDIFLTNYQSNELKSGVLAYDISDHLPIILCVKSPNKEKLAQRKVTFQRILPNQLEAFRRDVMRVDWSDVFNSSDVNSAYDCFIQKFTDIYISCFPFVTINLSRKIRKPWINGDLMARIKIKNDMFHRFIQTKDIILLREFKKYRNKLNKDIKKAKAHYLEKSFSAVKNNSKSTWRKLNEVLCRSQRTSPVEELLINGIIVNGASLADAFNDHFASLPTPQLSRHTKLSNNPPCPHSLFLTPTSDEEISSIFLNLKNSRSCDTQGMQIEPLKYVIDCIAPVLTHIFNLSFTTGTFPKQLQVAKVKPIYKKGDHNDLGNYRPISILPAFSKGLEKLLLVRLVSFLDTLDALSSAQYGFRKHRSTQLALLDQKEYILHNIEAKKLVLGVFIDFTKAFDYLNRTLLLEKLESYGIRGNAWELIKSYLSHRCQFVEVNGHPSHLIQTHTGVPQGSILGPLLFNLYLNDIDSLDDRAKFVIYADDTSIFFSSDDSTELFMIANSVLAKVAAWAQENGLVISIPKTKAIVFRPKTRQIPPNLTLSLNNTEIEIVSEFKTLGVIFTEHMSWDRHVDYISSKLASINGILYRHRDFLPKNILLLLYNSLFVSHLQYCSLVWGTTTLTNINKLSILQRRVLRIITRSQYDCDIYSVMQNLGIIRFENMYNYHLCLGLIREKKAKCNSLIRFAELAIKGPSRYPTRNLEFWKVHSFRTNYGFQTLKYRIPNILNTYLKDNIDILDLKPHELKSLFL